MKIGDPIPITESSLPVPLRPDLLPCPFCGKAPEYGMNGHAEVYFWPEYVECGGCRITFRTGELGCENAPAKWNTRHGN